MGRKRTAGLIQRKGIWHIDKQLRGKRLCESTGERDLAKAEDYLVRRIEETRQAIIFGVRPKRSFRKAATKYLEENTHKRRLCDEATHLRQLDPFIGDLPLEGVHMGTLQNFIKHRQHGGLKTKSINLALGIVKHILNVAATEWLDENNLTWLQNTTENKTVTCYRCAQALPVVMGRASAIVSRIAAASCHGIVQGQYRHAGPRGLFLAVGL